MILVRETVSPGNEIVLPEGTGCFYNGKFYGCFWMIEARGENMVPTIATTVRIPRTLTPVLIVVRSPSKCQRQRPDPAVGARLRLHTGVKTYDRSRIGCLDRTFVDFGTKVLCRHCTPAPPLFWYPLTVPHPDSYFTLYNEKTVQVECLFISIFDEEGQPGCRHEILRHSAVFKPTPVDKLCSRSN